MLFTTEAPFTLVPPRSKSAASPMPQLRPPQVVTEVVVVAVLVVVFVVVELVGAPESAAAICASAA